MLRWRDEVSKIVHQAKLKKVAEIGIWKGELSTKLWKIDTVEELYLIDPMKYEFNDFEHNGQRYQCTMGRDLLQQDKLDEMWNSIYSAKPDKVTMLRTTSELASKMFEDKYFDFVFIDAIHTYEHVKQDIQLWLPKIKSGGYLVGDDYYGEFEGVKKAVDELLNVNLIDKIWIYKLP